MKLNLLSIAVSFCFFIIACNTQTKEKMSNFEWPKDIKPPVAPIKEHLRIIHNDTVADNYFWLNDYFKKGPDSTSVVKYIEEENAYLDTMMSGTKAFQQKLYAEMKGRIKEKDESVPVLKNGYYYYTRTDEGKEYYKYCRKRETLMRQKKYYLTLMKWQKVMLIIQQPGLI